MPRVWNKSRDINIPRDAVYCGRPSKWGNPFSIGKNNTREEVISKYESWILKQSQLMRDAQKELRGRDLICFCAPLACHCDALIKIANCIGKCGYCDNCYLDYVTTKEM